MNDVLSPVVTHAGSWTAMSNSHQMSMVTVYPYIRSVRKLGLQIDYAKIGRKYGLDEVYLKDRNKRIPIELVQEQASEAVRRLGEPLIGLKAAQLLKITQMEGFKDLMFVGHNVKEALEIFDRYMPIFSEMGNMTLTPKDQKYRLVFKTSITGDINQQLIDGRMMFLYKYARCLGGQGFTALHLKHACPENCERYYQSAYKIPVHFSQTETYFELETKWLNHEIINFHEPSYQKLSNAEKTLNKRKENVSLEEQVQFIIRRMLKTGKVTNIQVAESLGLNVRTFQRRLKSNNIAYAELLERTRKQLALEYLSSPGKPINQIATLVGYKDLSSFLRAFKSWTGMGPGKYRELNFDN